jgi:hypothetical protein
LFYFYQSTELVVAFYDILLSALWMLCISNQLSGDYSNPAHPSSRPWYLAMSCKVVDGPEANACTIAQASFATSVFIL